MDYGKINRSHFIAFLHIYIYMARKAALGNYIIVNIQSSYSLQEMDIIPLSKNESLRR